MTGGPDRFAEPDIFAVIDGTWPAARLWRDGVWTLREGRGGGSRVSAATLSGPPEAAAQPDAIAAAEAAMRGIGQHPIFMIRPGEQTLDAALAARGYARVDPVIAYACPVAQLTDLDLPRVRVFHIWEPLAIMYDIWRAGGIGPARWAVMDRAPGPKTGLLARFNDKPGGAGFVAIHQGAAMVHALEILPHQRRQGLGQWMMRGAAFWARDNGADWLTVMCTEANAGANGLYSSLGMREVARYHYRRAPEED